MDFGFEPASQPASHKLEVGTIYVAFEVSRLVK